MKLLAIDHGTRRTGLAVSDETGLLARPLVVIERVGSPAGMTDLLEVIGTEAPDLVIVGLPRTPSGEEGEQAQAVRAFVGRLRRACPAPIELVDERLTTRIAAARGGRAAEDARAAAVLLQGVLDARRPTMPRQADG